MVLLKKRINSLLSWSTHLVRNFAFELGSETAETSLQLDFQFSSLCKAIRTMVRPNYGFTLIQLSEIAGQFRTEEEHVRTVSSL